MDVTSFLIFPSYITTISCMPDMTPTSLIEAVAPRTGKFIKNDLRFYEI